jgi:hypothetical protein
MTHNVPLAAFAFVEHDETLLLRVQEGTVGRNASILRNFLISGLVQVDKSIHNDALWAAILGLDWQLDS